MGTPEAVQDLINLEIPKHRRIWKPFMEKYDCRIIGEVGVFRGENFHLMIEHNPDVAIAVDAWIDDGIIARNDSGLSQERLDEQYECFRASIMNKPFVKILREYTADAASKFPDDYFDLVYIDADHTYEGCLSDIESWFPKIKKGKFLTGDDFSNKVAPHTGIKFGVIKAVRRFSKTNNLTFYTLPRHGWAIIK